MLGAQQDGAGPSEGSGCRDRLGDRTTMQSVVPIARECELDGMAICSLGALTYDLAACEAADSRPLSPASLADAVDTLHA